MAKKPKQGEAGVTVERGIVRRNRGGQVRYYVRYVDVDGKRKQRLAPPSLEGTKPAGKKRGRKPKGEK